MPENDRKEVYRSVVDYHNSLVLMRFTVAGLHLAGSAFLINALFCNNQQWGGTKFTVCFMGLVLTSIVFIIEVRTRCLLKNLGEFGIKIEEKFKHESLNVNCVEIKGFFGLMKNQPIQPPFPKIVTHSIGLYSLYIVFLLFWLVILHVKF